MKSHLNKLEDIDRTKNPFKVPDNYFAQFNKEIMELLPEREPAPQKTVTLWDKVKPWVYMAAMFVGLYFMIQFLSVRSTDNRLASRQALMQIAHEGAGQTNNNWSTVQISEEEFYQYLEQQLVDDGYYDYIYDQYYLN